MTYIKWFKDISATDVSSCGGKGASLGELMRASMPFADGFVLTVDACGEDITKWSDDLYKAYDQLQSKNE